MLGGSFGVAMLRNGMSVVLMLSFFLMLDRPRLPIKKAVFSYVVFGMVSVRQCQFREDGIVIFSSHDWDFLYLNEQGCDLCVAL